MYAKCCNFSFQSKTRKRAYSNVLTVASMTVAILLAACSGEQHPSENAINQIDDSKELVSVTTAPECTKGQMWEFVVNNAKRTADEYAANNNPSAGFVGLNMDIEFIKQYGGEFEGRYLLKIINEQDGNISLAMLLPLFDENRASDNLDDEATLWRVVMAKYNGKEF